ncbi:MAG TPA: ribonuclease HIII [Chlamydiales bacterium]|nr:ribonuclease HIII [Chlamydiales bacterium]
MGDIFVTTLAKEKIEVLKNDLLSQGFELSTPPHTYFQAKKPGLTCTLYTSLKLTVQGKEKGPFIEFYLEPELLQSFEWSLKNTNELHTSPKNETARIGVDEAGKGDFFGPLCVAAVFAGSDEVQKLVKMGVRDSKSIRPAEIMKLAAMIQKEFKHSIIRIFPLKYNELWAKFGNLNKLLAWGHATAIENLSQLSGCKVAIIDKFAHDHEVINALKRKKIAIDLTQRTKGEEDPVVAAASILARAAFVDGIDKLGKEVGMTLPKGASKQVIEAGKALVAAQGKGVLERVSKQHFKTTQDVLSTGQTG